MKTESGWAQYLKGAAHTKAVKLDVDQATIGDIAAYIHSRIVVAAVTREEAHPEEVLKAGNADAGKTYFNGAGGCAKCHQVDGNLKGVGGKYDPHHSAGQDRQSARRAGAVDAAAGLALPTRTRSQPPLHFRAERP